MHAPEVTPAGLLPVEPWRARLVAYGIALLRIGFGLVFLTNGLAKATGWDGIHPFPGFLIDYDGAKDILAFDVQTHPVGIYKDFIENVVLDLQHLWPAPHRHRDRRRPHARDRRLRQRGRTDRHPLRAPPTSRTGIATSGPGSTPSSGSRCSRCSSSAPAAISASTPPPRVPPAAPQALAHHRLNAPAAAPDNDRRQQGDRRHDHRCRRQLRRGPRPRDRGHRRSSATHIRDATAAFPRAALDALARDGLLGLISAPKSVAWASDSPPPSTSSSASLATAPPLPWSCACTTPPLRSSRPTAPRGARGRCLRPLHRHPRILRGRLAQPLLGPRRRRHPRRRQRSPRRPQELGHLRRRGRCLRLVQSADRRRRRQHALARPRRRPGPHRPRSLRRPRPPRQLLCPDRCAGRDRPPPPPCWARTARDST